MQSTCVGTDSPRSTASSEQPCIDRRCGPTLAPVGYGMRVLQQIRGASSLSSVLRIVSGKCRGDPLVGNAGVEGERKLLGASPIDDPLCKGKSPA